MKQTNNATKSEKLTYASRIFHKVTDSNPSISGSKAIQHS